MPETDKSRTQKALHNLTANPLQEMRTKRVRVFITPGNKTSPQHLKFACINEENNDVIYISSATRMKMKGNIHPDAIDEVLLLATPARLAGSNNRLTSLELHPVGNNLLWVTPTQTGCSVMILDWGDHMYSMVHLQPLPDDQLASWRQDIFKKDTALKPKHKNYSLREEITKIINTEKNRRPKRYILVQSMRAGSQGSFLQIIGVKVGTIWRFFLQSYNKNKTRGTLHVFELEWRRWNGGATYLAASV